MLLLGGVEPGAPDALGGAATVQVRGDAAQVERVVGPQDHAEVDVPGGGDNALVQHVADLVREGILHAREQLAVRAVTGLCGDAAVPAGAFEGLVRTLGEVGLGRLAARRQGCLLYTSPSPRDQRGSRMPSSA